MRVAPDAAILIEVTMS
uniref:Uncharacterized protein n=1 Tax=Arundo donax TaxID=35708 RepID=A0A0A8ZQC9_ARUDO